MCVHMHVCMCVQKWKNVCKNRHSLPVGGLIFSYLTEEEEIGLFSQQKMTCRALENSPTTANQDFETWETHVILEKGVTKNREHVQFWGKRSFVKICDAKNILYSKEMTFTSLM